MFIDVCIGGRGSHSKLESSSFTDFAEDDTDEKQFFGIGNGGDNDKWLKSLSEEKQKAITEYTYEQDRKRSYKVSN